MCNNSPAESTSPENGWRWSVGPTPLCRGSAEARRPVHGATSTGLSRQASAARAEVWAARPDGAPVSADIGGSSEYSNLEGIIDMFVLISAINCCDA